MNADDWSVKEVWLIMTGNPNLMAPGAESQIHEKFPYQGKLLPKVIDVMEIHLSRYLRRESMGCPKRIRHSKTSSLYKDSA